MRLVRAKWRCLVLGAYGDVIDKVTVVMKGPGPAPFERYRDPFLFVPCIRMQAARCGRTRSIRARRVLTTTADRRPQTSTEHNYSHLIQYYY